MKKPKLLIVGVLLVLIALWGGFYAAYQVDSKHWALFPIIYTGAGMAALGIWLAVEGLSV